MSPRRLRGIVVFTQLFLFFMPGAAHALTIAGAKINKGAVQVKGAKAAPFAVITWEGQNVGQASKSGAFRFTTSILPSDCVGEVGDGVATVGAVIKSCGPAGPPGASTPGLVVKDANGVLIGPLVSDSAVALAGPDGPVAVSIGTGRFKEYAAFDYESNDCSGIPLLAVPNEGEYYPLLDESVQILNRKVLLRPQDGPLLDRRSTDSRPRTAEQCAALSVNWFFIPPDRCCCPTPNCQGVFTGRFAPARGEIDISGFVPPFHVELR
jgi:hypothetical protein